jgi:23S rRNA (pseudouridine1915-N3)-methyltransferase
MPFLDGWLAPKTMLHLRFIVVDRTKSAFLREGESHYLKRLRNFAQVEWVELKRVPFKKRQKDNEIMWQEWQTIEKRLSPQEYTFALDRRGKPYDSKGLAVRLEDLSMGHPRFAFVIGGPLGLARNALERAQETLSLSPLTFTHEMSRLILLEQVYRALTLIQGKKYHK